MEIPSGSIAKRFDCDLLHYLQSASSTSSAIYFDHVPPPSSTSTSCFDFALYDYLHSRHISSSTGTSCFDLALDIQAEVGRTMIDSRYLNKTVILLKTFFLYVRKCRRRRNREDLLKHDQEDRGNIIPESLRRNIICFRIQNVAIRMIHDLGSALLQYKHSRWSDEHILQLALIRSEQNIALFFGTEIVKLCTSVFDCYSPGDPQLLMNLIDVLFVTLDSAFNVEQWEISDTIRKKLLLPSNLIGFAAMRGVECTQLTDLLTSVAAVSARQITVSLSEIGIFDVCGQNIYEIPELIHKKVNALDPQILETCIHVLTASKKQPRSSYALALEGNKCPMVVPFIDSLHDHLVDLLGSYASSQVRNQMLKLYQGVRYLKAFAKTKEKLGDEMTDLIELAVCDAGIMILSLSVNEIKESLPMPKETDLGLFHLHKVLKYLMAEIAHNYPLRSPDSSFNYPRCNLLGCMDFFLENLKQLARCREADDSIVFLLDRIQMVQKDLEFLRPFLENIKEQRYQNGKLQAFWSHVMVAAYKAELLIDSALVGDKYEDSLDAVARDINLLKIEALEIHNGQTQRVFG